MAMICSQSGPWDGVMKAVKIAELKNRLSYYLRRVQRGESILVCDRERVIARIDRVDAHTPVSEPDGEWSERLERRGVIRRGTGKLPRQCMPGGPPSGPTSWRLFFESGKRGGEILGQFGGGAPPGRAGALVSGRRLGRR